MTDYSISIFLDTRRIKTNEKYPVKLRVFTPNPRKQMLYPTIFDFTIDEFKDIWETLKPAKKYKEIKRKLNELEEKALKIAEKIVPFTIEGFEKKINRRKDDGISIPYHYEELIDELKKRDQFNTADTYSLSEKSIKKFTEEKLKKNYSKLTLLDITSDWLKDYEDYFTKEQNRSLTTVSMYLRVLRTIFNKAISEGEIEQKSYPFGRRKYQVPATKNVKKALSKAELKQLFVSECINEGQQKSKDFWFFSFSCNGMNFKDIALLKYKDIHNDKIEFLRAKTTSTSKGNLKSITVYLNDYSKDFINKYGNENKSPENYVFDILSNDMTAEKKQKRVKDFITNVNRRLKTLCKDNGLPESISTYWARHSYATNAIRKGASMEFIQESLGHGNLKTTQGYFAGFDSESKKEFATSIMNFD